MEKVKGFATHVQTLGFIARLEHDKTDRHFRVVSFVDGFAPSTTEVYPVTFTLAQRRGQQAVAMEVAPEVHRR